MLKRIIIFALFSLPVFAASVAVSVIKPVTSTMPITIEANGVVTSKNKTLITSRTTGIMHATVTQNAFVHKNEIIAKVSNPLRDKKLRFFKNRLTLQKKEMKIEQNKLDTVKKKYDMGVGSKDNYLSEKLLVEQLIGTNNTTKHEYQALQLEQKNETVYAPDNGVITNLQADNTYLIYGSPIGDLLNTNNDVKLFVDASYAKQVKKGMKVLLQNSYKDCEATVVHVLQKSTHNLVEVIVQPTIKLPLDLNIDAKIVLKDVKGTLIPKEAIVLVNNHPAVYVIDTKNMAHLHLITIEKDMISSALIKGTFEKDTKIALKNAYMLHDNLEVSVK